MARVNKRSHFLAYTYL